MKPSSYRQYSHKIKRMIVKSKNPNLFPELRIPRSTAYHWIRHGVRRPYGIIKTDDIGKNTNPYSETTLKALSLIMKTMSSSIEMGHLADDEKLEIRLALKAGYLKNYLNASQANQLRNQLYSCPKAYDGLCIKRYPVKITVTEFTEMKKFYESSSYAHMPVCSLAILAKRKGIVNCSPQTWYRYAKKFKWKRFYHEEKKKTLGRRRGVHALKPHEIWQIDVSQIPLKDGSHCYLQAIIDNYSRYIVGWQVSKKISRKITQSLIKYSLGKSGFDTNCHRLLISDGGPEKKRLVSEKFPLIKQRIARKEIRGANTLIEVFFKTLKHDYLKFQELNSIEETTNMIQFFIYQHNHKIPRVALNGKVPIEALQRKSIEIKTTDKSIQKRIEINRNTSCWIC